MTSTVIHGATIVTMDGKNTIHYDAALAIAGGRIAAVGPSDPIA